MKKRFIVTLKNGNTYDMTVEEVDASAAVTVDALAAPAAPKAAPAPAPKAAAAGSVAVKAPLQGTVMKVNVKPGDTVTKGAPVAVIEALKMENDVPAPQDGVVASVDVKSGDSVKTDQVLLTLK